MLQPVSRDWGFYGVSTSEAICTARTSFELIPSPHSEPLTNNKGVLETYPTPGLCRSHPVSIGCYPVHWIIHYLALLEFGKGLRVRSQRYQQAIVWKFETYSSVFSVNILESWDASRLFRHPVRQSVAFSETATRASKGSGGLSLGKTGLFFISLTNKKQTNKHDRDILASTCLQIFFIPLKNAFLILSAYRIIVVFFIWGKSGPLLSGGGGGCGKTALSSIIYHGLGFYSQKVPDKVKTHAAC